MKVTGIPNIMQNFIHFHLKTHVLVTERTPGRRHGI